METEHGDTVVEKAVTFVKDMLGIHPPAPDVEARPEYTDTAPEITSENALRLNPNEFAMKSIGELSPETASSPDSHLSANRADSDTTIDETEAERLRREEEEHPRQKTASELAMESTPFRLGKQADVLSLLTGPPHWRPFSSKNRFEPETTPRGHHAQERKCLFRDPHSQAIL